MTPDLLALDGIRVIDLSRVIAGPWCGALLSDLGADVVKVEDTGSGDESRTWPPHKDGEAAAYLLFNRNQRAKTGLGQRVDGSLLETAVSLLAFHAEGYLLTGAVPKALGSGHPSLSPYRNFKCRDGQWIFVAAANDRFWGKLVRVLGLDELAADPKFAVNQQRVKNRVELETLLEQVIGDRDREELL